MFKSVLLFGFAFALANGDPIPTSRVLRNGEFNRYYLYNRQVSASGVQLTVTGTPSTDILPGVTTVVVIHGHGGTYQASPNPDIRRELLELEEHVNVIAVDWSIYASMSYTSADNAIMSIGEHIASLLVFQDILPGNVHIVGFNLGAHIAGVVGKSLRGIARITGLDPSTTTTPLARTDALYVEVIHTDGGSALSNGMGVKMGHADFFPNGGNWQPGCATLECNHNRAWQYFTASINDNPFLSYCCNSIWEKDVNLCTGTHLSMGNNRLSKTPCQSGIYRVNTGNSYPYL
ncbi:pancreatic lipase-related protein 2 [Amyelois transitella]|uniref:pancreatic lipase-related protein 2 n=1 Tax=Amyelois transitella TaxID=680683 RepID=UPI00067E2C38|nr:pancreatic lipase-related protein 2 [Amyelois transitella]